MPKNSVLSRPRVSAAPSRHDFDRSFTCNFSQSNGMILPVFCEPVIGGTKGILNSRRFTRTKNVVFPAFQSVTQHVDFYAVPLRLLWSYWNDFKLNINDINFSNNIPSQSILGDLSLASLPASVPFAYFNQHIIDYFNINTWLGSLSTRLRKCSDCIRLLDALGYGDVLSIGSSNNYAQSLFKLAAYQKVYYDHYRNTSYENNQPFAYNLDWLSMKSANVDQLVYFLSTSSGTANQQRNAFSLMSELHYVNYRNDYFHNIYPSLNYSLSEPTGGDWNLPSDVVGVSWYPSGWDSSSAMNQAVDGSTSVGQTALFGASLLNSYSGAAANQNAISAQGIRALFALDKLMRASAYAPKHVKDQIEARFGVKVNPAKVSHESQYLGGFLNDIIFGEVTSTANTASAGDPSNLGEIGGKGIGSGDFSKDIEFYCEEDSLIIGVQYFLPRAQYDSLGSKAWNIKLTKNDFFQPEFEHLGLRPLYQKELNLRVLGNLNNPIGYKEPNQEYKVGIDQNLGAFQTSYNMPVLNADEDAITSTTRTMELSAFVVHSATPQAYSGSPADFRYFKAFPEDLNSIFEESYDGTVVTDQFYGNLHFKFAVNAPMSVHGNPIL